MSALPPLLSRSGAARGRPRLTRMSHEHDVRERRFDEGDRDAWERPVGETDLFDPARRDIYNFIDANVTPFLKFGQKNEIIIVVVGGKTVVQEVRLGFYDDPKRYP